MLGQVLDWRSSQRQDEGGCESESEPGIESCCCSARKRKMKKDVARRSMVFSSSSFSWKQPPASPPASGRLLSCYCRLFVCGTHLSSGWEKWAHFSSVSVQLRLLCFVQVQLLLACFSAVMTASDPEAEGLLSKPLLSFHQLHCLWPEKALAHGQEIFRSSRRFSLCLSWSGSLGGSSWVDLHERSAGQMPDWKEAM